MLEHPPSRLSTWVESLQFDWAPFHSYGVEVRVRKGDHILHEGLPLDGVYVVLEGRVRLCRWSPTGEEKTVLVVGQNALFDEIGAMQPDRTSTTSAVASSDAWLMRVPIVTFHQLFMATPALAHFIWQNISDKYQLALSQLTALSYSTAQYRIVHHLLELGMTYGAPAPCPRRGTGTDATHAAPAEGARDAGDGVRISLRFTQQEMANLAGTTRVTVAQVFRKLESLHLLTRVGGYFCIPSVSALRQLLEDPKASHIERNRRSETGQ
ncbi:MAG: Crp/Fnr family transcriptional regulator [Alicyclobacillus sp.]|nr:Crp/Fnr family transcriptional regulator [Alicyclobacillus sp.]